MTLNLCIKIVTRTIRYTTDNTIPLNWPWHLTFQTNNTHTIHFIYLFLHLSYTKQIHFNFIVYTKRALLYISDLSLLFFFCFLRYSCFDAITTDLTQPHLLNKSVNLLFTRWYIKKCKNRFKKHWEHPRLKG